MAEFYELVERARNPLRLRIAALEAEVAAYDKDLTASIKGNELLWAFVHAFDAWCERGFDDGWREYKRMIKARDDLPEAE